MANKDDEKTLLVMRKRLDLAISAYSDSRACELDDLRFLAGSPDNQWQWPQGVLNSRGGMQGQAVNARPTLTINKLPQHKNQVTNDMRQNRPAGKVIPVDDKADAAVAEIFDGMVKHIEYASDADVAQDTATDNQVTFGEGYWRLTTEYCDENSFDQDIKIVRLRNSFSVYMDPMMQHPCGEDAEWGLIATDMLVEDYEDTWPDALPVSSIEQYGTGDTGASAWANQETVRVAEYFYKEKTTSKLLLFGDGSTAFAGSKEADMAAMMGLQSVRERDSERVNICWVKTNGYEILEKGVWPGRWIPIIRVVGNEFEVEGRLYYSGIVRNAKDAQRLYNYWKSQEAEMLALAPKAPFIGYSGQFEGYEYQWKTANTNNWPYLEVNTDVADGAGNPLPLPQRAAPPLPQAGLLQAAMGASDDIKSTTGQYDASLGAEANEKSGKAIMARERQTDTGTYHYVDNYSRAVRFSTRQIVDLIPKIYDTKRIARIIGVDGEVDHVKLNPEQPQALQEVRDQETNAVIERIYNLGVGKYDVCVTTGPSYMTKRQEAMDAMKDILRGNPALWQVAGDLFAKNMDWPGAEELAERLKKTIDPKLLGDDEESPELAAAKQQMQQMGQELDQLHSMLQNVGKSFEAQKAANEEFRADIEAYNAETKRLQVIAGAASPEEIKAVVQRTLQEMLAQEPLQQEEREDGENGAGGGVLRGSAPTAGAVTS